MMAKANGADIESIVGILGGVIMGGLALYNITKSSSSSDNSTKKNIDFEDNHGTKNVRTKIEKEDHMKVNGNRNGYSNGHSSNMNGGGKSYYEDDDDDDVKKSIPSWMSSHDVFVAEHEVYPATPEWQSKYQPAEIKGKHRQQHEILPRFELEEKHGGDHFKPSRTSKVDSHSVSRGVPNISQMKLSSVNKAIAHIAVLFSDSVFVYPISTLGYLGEQLLGLQRKAPETIMNIHNEFVDVKRMETRPGAASVVVGASSAGLNVSILTSSTALKMMIPSLLKLVRKRLPVVLHTSSLKIGTNDLSISQDWSDVLALRSTGIALVSSASAQEASDMAIISHIVTRLAHVPVLHFFDGTRVLNNRVDFQPISEETLKKKIPNILKHPDHFFSDNHESDLIHAFEHALKSAHHANIVSKSYDFFEYTGPENPEAVIVTMGALSNTFEHLLASGQLPPYLSNRVGLITVRILRPWSANHFLQVLPESTQRVCVLNSCSISSTGQYQNKSNDLFQDVASTFHTLASSENEVTPMLISGKTLSHQDGFDLNQALAVIDNAISDVPQPGFIVSHDASISSLKIGPAIPYQQSVADQIKGHEKGETLVRRMIVWEQGPSAVPFGKKPENISEGTEDEPTAGLAFTLQRHLSGTHALQNVAIDPHAGIEDGGLQRSELLLTQNHQGIPKFLETTFASTGTDVVLCENHALQLAEEAGIDVLKSCNEHHGILIVANGWGSDAVEVAVPENEAEGEGESATAVQGPEPIIVPESLKKRASSKGIRLFTFESGAIVHAAGFYEMDEFYRGASRWLANIAALSLLSADIYIPSIAHLRKAITQSLPGSMQHWKALNNLAESLDGISANLHEVRLEKNPRRQGAMSSASKVMNISYNMDDNVSQHSGSNRMMNHNTFSTSLKKGTVTREFIPKIPAALAVKTKERRLPKSAMAANHEVAWSFMFKDRFNTQKVLKPRDHGVYHVKLTKKRRLTPESYSRNIFHLEFDCSGTDLTYQIGDALGVFGHNDENEVDEFLKFYNVDPNAFISRPLGEMATGNQSEEKVELVSARNLFVQHLDLFGRPGKKFYIWLAQYAQSRYEYLRLMHIGTDDTEAFKLGVAETVTYADILKQFRSAHPPVEDLARVIPAIKPRHYSIASSNKMNPTSVHLLVVAVDWITPSGRKRCGQCTRYLASLDPENSEEDIMVAVDIVPSVLRLPESHKQPVIMAGLGTGMAPFRAFIQERKMIKELGYEVGEMVLYFGARHRHEEFLYGEELEEYEREGLVRLGLAFSRDQKEKVYIQHLIEKDGSKLKHLFEDEDGHFYLCGPTWPVPDVRDAVAKGLNPELFAQKGEIDVQKIEDLKEKGAWVLEVY